MKRKNIITVIVLSLISTSILVARAEEPQVALRVQDSKIKDVQIAPFHGDKSGAVSLTFDDGSANQYLAAVPLLDKHQIKASFFVIAGLTRGTEREPLVVRKDNWGEVTWDQWRQAARKGHEIGNHSMTHPFMTRISDDQLLREINESSALIQKEIGKAPISFVAPYNIINAHTRGMILARHLCLREQWTEFGGAKFNMTFAKTAIDNAVAQHQWLVPMIHGVDNAYHPITSAQFDQVLSYLESNRDKLWVDTYGNVGCYQQEYKTTQVQVLSKSREEMRFKLHGTLDARKYSVPLTVVVQRYWNNTDQLQAHVVGVDKPVAITTLPDRILVDVPYGETEVRLDIKPFVPGKSGGAVAKPVAMNELTGEELAELD